jgi:hypothetical protein
MLDTKRYCNLQDEISKEEEDEKIQQQKARA